MGSDFPYQGRNSNSAPHRDVLHLGLDNMSTAGVLLAGSAAIVEAAPVIGFGGLAVGIYETGKAGLHLAEIALPDGSAKSAVRSANEAIEGFDRATGIAAVEGAVGNTALGIMRKITGGPGM